MVIREVREVREIREIREFKGSPIIPLSHYPIVPLSHCPIVSLSHCPIVLLSHCPIVLSSHCPIVPLSHRPIVPSSAMTLDQMQSSCRRLLCFCGYVGCLHTGHSYKTKTDDFYKSSALHQFSGERGIRTPGTVARTPHFECGPFDHSGISPFAGANILIFFYLVTLRRYFFLNYHL